MDIQIKKGLLDICVLASLSDADSYGYKIIRDISPYIQISESTLYPILKRLEYSQCLTTYTMEHNGRLRKYYRITPVGLARITDFLKEWGEVERVYDFIARKERHE